MSDPRIRKPLRPRCILCDRGYNKIDGNHYMDGGFIGVCNKEKDTMKQPTPEQLNDPDWWDANAPEGAEYVAIAPDNTLIFYRQDSVGTWQIWGVRHQQWLFDGLSHDAGGPPYELTSRPTKNLHPNCNGDYLMTPTIFSNNLTAAEAERLAYLIEECGEVIQAATKILRHGYESRHPAGGPTNRELLTKELAHVSVARRMMWLSRDYNWDELCEAQDKKYQEIQKYLHHNTFTYKRLRDG